VRFADIENAYIDEGAVIGEGTLIGPCVTIDGETEIGRDCVIGQNTEIRKSKIGNNTKVLQSVINESSVGDDTNVGPFAYMRPGSKVGNGCKVGDFVEIKNSVLGDGSKASHLTYIGDSDVGKNVNLGCGVVFVNYDGKNKHRSTVGDNSFVGCNVNIISPVNVSNNSYVAAGTTVTKNVPEGSLYIGRSKEMVLEGWVEKRGLLKKD
jgi:bifunctional UDP-N-acetylglucosamine pyrophosphorylase/glucosamine-1-phosphate N-acetyltransferase